jgi:pilus assembly protein CpaD
MNSNMQYLLRGLCLAAMLMAGSCAAPTKDGNMRMEDGAANNPISVEPSYQSLKLPYAGTLSSADQARFEAFVAGYMGHGNGSIAVSAPAGNMSPAMITFFAQRINEMGVARDHILVATHDAPDGDMRVEINYVSYQAHTDKCGDWSENLAFTEDNDTPKNFGCSVQQNIAAQIADPRDLLHPRDMQDASAVRRDTVIGNYELGKITSSEKRSSGLGDEQNGTSSQVGH